MGAGGPDVGATAGSARRPVLRFTLAFAAFSGVLCAVSSLPEWGFVVRGYSGASAALSCAVLNALGQHCRVIGAGIASPRFAVTVLQGCAAGDLFAFFCAWLMAFPAPYWKKAAGLAAGTLALTLLNVSRITAVFLVGAYRPGLFVTIHEEFWPGLLVLGTVLLGLGWMRWVGPRGVPWGESLPRVSRRFVVAFGLLLIPWPGMAALCGDALRGAAGLAFTTPAGPREVTLERHGGHGTRIVIANRRLLGADGSGPVRNLDLNAYSVVWRPASLFLALVLAAPLSAGRRVQALVMGGVCLGVYILLSLNMAIWNESTEVALVALTPNWKGLANGAEATLLEGLGVTVPCLVWLLTAGWRMEPALPGRGR
jgi:exosortase/archaeosortase family protein